MHFCFLWSCFLQFQSYVVKNASKNVNWDVSEATHLLNFALPYCGDISKNEDLKLPFVLFSQGINTAP